MASLIPDPLNLSLVPPPPECENENTAIEAIRRMFVDKVQHDHIIGTSNPDGKPQTPAKRAAFIKQHGSAFGRLEVVGNLDPKYRIGIFQPNAHYAAWVRFSSDTPDYNADRPPNNTAGIGIKLFNVQGPKMMEQDVNATTLDLILQNTPSFFAADAMEMCEFKTAALNGTLDLWLQDHPETAKILADGDATFVDSLLSEPMWSCIPYKFGSGDDDLGYCKYKLAPTPGYPPQPLEAVAPDLPNYLALDLRQRLLNGEARFDFFVQLRTNPAVQSVTNARDIWDEAIAVPVKVATLILPQQDTMVRGQAEYGESLSFSIFRTLAEMIPIGSIADARKLVYQSSAETRRNFNGQTVGEPAQPRPSGPLSPPYDSTLSWPPAAQSEGGGNGDNAVAYAMIHPGIGVARVGNSTTDFYIGPEYPSAPPPPTGSMRDATGAIKRQAARFRIYGYNAAGVAIKELTPDNADITWSVKLANKKAQWFKYDKAMDLMDAPAVGLRNPDITGKDRQQLAITPTPKSIQGKNKSGAQFRFDDGKFKNTVVPLGEIQTDADGRLLVLGGYGKSASPGNAPMVIIQDGKEHNFNSSVDWYDDTSDGPVSATVKVDGVAIPVTSAWVIVGPPNFAPDILGFRTMYDLARNVMSEAGRLAFDPTPSFQDDILPLLQRLTQLQWVNAGFAYLFGAQGIPGTGGIYPLLDSDFLRRVSTLPENGHDDYFLERRKIFKRFLLPDDTTLPLTGGDQMFWPCLYGDELGDDPPKNLGDLLPVTQQTYQHLKNWAAGNFYADYDPECVPDPDALSNASVADQPALLDEGPLTFCLADAFHPGCELTWPMRHPSIYSGLARINEYDPTLGPRDYGTQLDRTTALQPGGPLYGQEAGDLTRWMGLPWQGDTARCRAGYDYEFACLLPSYWPARVPNHVLAKEEYDTIMDTTLSAEARKKAFSRRRLWLRSFMVTAGKDNNEGLMELMVTDFDQMGIVEKVVGPSDLSPIPTVLYVESTKPGAASAPVVFASKIDGTLIDGAAEKLKAIGWSEEMLTDFLRKR